MEPKTSKNLDLYWKIFSLLSPDGFASLKKKKKTCHFRFLFFMQGLCDVTPEGYHHLTKLLMNLANGKVVVALEVKQFTTL